MNKKHTFLAFLESLKTKSNSSMIESIKAGYNLMEDGYDDTVARREKYNEVSPDRMLTFALRNGDITQEEYNNILSFKDAHTEPGEWEQYVRDCIGV